MLKNGSAEDPDRTRRFLDLVLDMGRINGAYVDTDLRHTRVHNSASEPPESEIIGSTDAELFSEEAAAPTTRLKREAIDTQSRVEDEFTFVKPWGQRRYRAAAEPLYDDDGGLEGAMFAAMDVSAGHRFLEQTTDSVFIVDPEWEVVFWNERIADRTGIPAEEVVDTNLWTTFGDEIPDELEARYREAMASGEAAEFEQYMPDPYDTWLDVRALPSDDGLLVCLQNISERKASETQLTNQRDTLSLLNEMLTHDIRNDLQMVTAYAEMVADELDEGSREHIETLTARANHAVELTKSASEVSKVLFTQEAQLERVSLREEVIAELENVRSAYPDAAVLEDGAIRDVTVTADDMLGSVFRNLLKNAIQHNDKPVPEVSVSTEERADEVVVRIADNGPGVPDDRKDAIFGKGEKGLASSGTGIGLYLVDMLLERYGGGISVSDTDPEGATFAVTLPKVVEDRSGE
jgi:PAS domain S-box-containing protein